MARRHELSLDSYDRLFPSQDTMPRGGFGNLIALPLQHGPRQHGNSVFLDDQLRPYPDDQQWAYLASVQRIDRRTVETIAGEATRRGSVLGVRAVEPNEDEDALTSIEVFGAAQGSVRNISASFRHVYIRHV
jgi:hypothetical protein